MRLLATALTASASNVYVLVPAALTVVILLGTRWYYLKTSREVKRLEAIGKHHLSFKLLVFQFRWCCKIDVVVA